MSDDSTNFEQHKSQLVAGLTVVAESMRKCAEIAEAFAALVNGGAIPVDSAAARMIRDFVVASKSNAITDDKTIGKRKRKTDALEEGEAPKRRKRKPKDPNAPKRPASSYILFQNEVRKELKALHPDISNHELLHMIAKQWQEMSEENKAVYHRAMATAKERYSLDKKAYDNRTPEEIQAANAAAAGAAVKKSRKGAKPAVPVAEKPPPPPQPAPAISPRSDSSEGSASEESDEDVQEEAEDDNSGSSEDERPAPDKRAIRRSVTTVTGKNGK